VITVVIEFNLRLKVRNPSSGIYAALKPAGTKRAAMAASWQDEQQLGESFRPERIRSLSAFDWEKISVHGGHQGELFKERPGR
jgi:hypothetical protein